jgi:hypothetical protein
MSSRYRGIKALLTWTTDWAIEHWPALSIVIGGAAITYLAAVSAALESYGPVAWGTVGLVTVFVLALVYAMVAWGTKTRTKARYDARLLEGGSIINPLEAVFVRKRIVLDQFVLPSHPLIEGKTFIDCDFIGPGCIYLHSGNSTGALRPPAVDAVWLAPGAQFTNMFTFRNCVFRNCSFQRITLFASLEYFDALKDSPVMSWIGVSPKPEDIVERMLIINPPIATTPAPLL